MVKNYPTTSILNKLVYCLILLIFFLCASSSVFAQDYTADNAADWDIFPVGNLEVIEVPDAAAEDGAAIQFTTSISTEEWFNSLAQTFQSNTPAIAEGNQYMISFKHRADAPRQIRVAVHARPTGTFGSEDNTYYNEFVEVGETYENFEFSFTSTGDAPGTVHVQLFAGGDDTTLYTDDFQINVEPGSSEEDEAYDSVSDWDVFPVGNLVVSEVDDADALNGNAIKFTTEVSTAEWFNSLAQTFQSNTPAVVEGDEYTVSFKHRADAPRQIRVAIHGRPADTFGPEDNTYYNEFVQVGETYENFEFSFVSTDMVPGTVHVQLFAGGDDTALYVDDFQINVEPGSIGEDEAYDSVSDWDIFPVGNLVVSEVDDADALNGDAIKFTTEVSTAEWFNSLAQTFQSNTPAVIEGDEYTVSFKHRADAPRQIRVAIHGRPTDTFGPEDNTYYNEFVQVGGTYEDFEFSFVSTDMVPGTVHVQLFAGGDDTALYVDDFDIVRERDGGGPPLTGEEPFEDDAQWNTYREGDLVQEIVDDASAVNAQAFRISPQTSIADREWFDTGFQIRQDFAVREAQGQRYRISFRYRAESNRQFRLSLLSRPLDTFGDSDITYFSDFLQASTEYQKFSTVVTSPATVPSAIYIGFLVGGSDVPLLIDDIQMEEAEPLRTEPTTLYVSPNGSDSNSGTENSPEGAWKTITYALSQLIPGDELLLNDGLYQENFLTLQGVNGDENTKTVVKSINKWGAKIESTAQFNVIFKIENSSYIEVDGIEVFNNNNVELEDWNPGVQFIRSNHITVRNVYAHDCGCNGISGREGDYFIIENNVVQDNAKTNPFNCSGISVYQPINLDDAPGFHIIIRNNVAFENECRLPFEPGGFDIPTDGNGIILDDFNQTQSEGIPPYTAASLVENNLAFNNGGAGIKVFEASNVTIRNNTTWHNNYVLQEFSSGIGEIGVQFVTGPMTVENNIAVKIFEQTGFGLFYQPSEGGSATFTDNVVVGASGFEGNPPVLNGNTIVSDNRQSFPRFANATTEVSFSDISDFKRYFGLRAESPALDVIPVDAAPSEDLDGTARPIGTLSDAGAYEGIQEGEGDLPVDGTLTANARRIATDISIDGEKDGAYIGDSYNLTKFQDAVASTEDGDLAGNWTSIWDEEFLYLRINVTDDSLINDSEDAGDDDGVEIYISGNNSENVEYGNNDFIYRIAYGEENALSELTKDAVSGVEAAIRDTDMGYAAEITIPWSNLGVSPADSLVVGIDVHINDDDGSGVENKLVWQDVLEDGTSDPSRFGEIVILDTDLPPALTKTDEVVEIDGTLDDSWDNAEPKAVARGLADTISDESDLSADWQALWDEENLYFFIAVNDDDLQNDSEQWFEDDGVEIYIDADNSKNSTYDDNDYQITIGWNNGNLVDDTKDNLGEGSVANVVDTETGYNVEVSIPWTALKTTPENGKFLGLDVHVIDDDEGGPRSGKLAWFATVDESFRNPSLFGNVFLEEDTDKPVVEGEIFGEVGTTSATQEWSKVDYTNMYNDPVVFVGPIGTRGNQPATVSVKNVGGSRFQWRVDEWEYLDGWHFPENASYIVVEEGVHNWNGKQIAAGKTRVGSSWKTIDLPDGFTERPMILPQITNLKSEQALTVRVRNVTTSSFELLVQGEEAIKKKDKEALRERVGWIAVAQNQGEDTDLGAFETELTGAVLTQRNYTLSLGQSYSTDRVFLGYAQTTNGFDPGTLRYRDASVTDSSVALFFQEEKSRDNEIVHVPEAIGYTIIDTPGNLRDSESTSEKPSDDGDTITGGLEIKLYPNPALNSILLFFPTADGTGEAEILIRDFFGREVLKSIYKNTQDAIDVSNLIKGLYVVQVTYNGETIRKLVFKN